VNATGMGKDRAGSPLSPSVAFPEGGYVWDFNYRGSLDFLVQARSQQANRSLVVEDGWRYFIHGWTEVIADVFDMAIPAAMIPRLSAVAAEVR
jgi:shikimate dehydrogenase